MRKVSIALILCTLGAPTYADVPIQVDPADVDQGVSGDPVLNAWFTDQVSWEQKADATAFRRAACEDARLEDSFHDLTCPCGRSGQRKEPRLRERPLRRRMEGHCGRGPGATSGFPFR